MVYKAATCSLVLLVVGLVCLAVAEDQNNEAYLPFGFWYKGYPKPSDIKKVRSICRDFLLLGQRSGILGLLSAEPRIDPKNVTRCTLPMLS
jgi:hypothetical protein